MKKSLIVSAMLCWSLAAHAQTPLANPEAQRVSPEEQARITTARLEYRPGVSILSGLVRTLKANPQLSEATKADADKLVAEATTFQAVGNNGEARRRLSHTIALLSRQPWTEKEEYAASLMLRPNLVASDLSGVNIVQLAQTYPSVYKLTTALQLRLSLAEAPKSLALDVVNTTSKPGIEIGTVEIPMRDLMDDPFRFDLNLTGVAEGSYLLTADILDGATSLGKMVSPIHLVRDWTARQRTMEQTLANIKGHESTKATIRYPADLAKSLNAGKREILGYDFAKEATRSDELLAALSTGKDLLYKAKGDNRRNYLMAESGEIMPYRIYVPTTWDGKKQLPLIVALHGANLDETNMLSRADGKLLKLAEANGYIVVSPLGYRINGAYGNLAMAGGPTALLQPMTPARLRMSDLSERDVMNVLELTATEYNVDRSRIYLMGNSMGGAGTFLLGAKYAEKFAALAPSAAGLGDPSRPEAPDFPYDRLTGMPLMIIVGEKDMGVLPSAKIGVAQLQKHGLAPIFVEVPGGTHGSSVEIMMPQIIEFFGKHSRHN